MRVALACDWFLKYTVPLATTLVAAGADVGLLCRDHAMEFGGSADERRRLLQEATTAGVTTFEIPGRISSASALPRAAAALARLERFQPELVHAQDNVDPRLFTAAIRRPAVVTVHDPAPHPGAPRRGRLQGAVRAAWMRRAHRIIVHGDALRDELAAHVDRTRIVVVPHGVSPARDPLPPPVEPRVLFFGRLEPYKGLPILVDAMQEVWRARPEVRLAVLGEGPEARAVPADDRIELSTGYVSERDVDEAFRRASVCVLPYVQASQSGVGLLALARGVPTIVSRVGALGELACDDTLRVAAGDRGELARAILRHLDHGLGLREASLAHVRERFSWPVVAGRTLALYREAVEGADSK
jgi:glycosyltransferase involved in cell wall biosynthesis